MADPRVIARIPQIKERLKRAMNMKVVTDRLNGGFQFRLHGFDYADFDRAGYPNPIRLNRIMEAQHFAGDAPLDPTDKNLTYYALCSFTRFSRTLYERASYFRPMVYDYRLIRLGNSSLDLLQTIFLDPSGGKEEDKVLYPMGQEDVLVSRIYKGVCVDSLTHKSTPIPEREKLQQIVAKPDSIGECLEFPKIDLPTENPPEFFQCSIMPRMIEMNFQFHIGQGYYLEYAAEVAARASMIGAYKGFGKGDICFRTLHKITDSYSKECFPMERLNISTWEDPECPGRAIFFIMRKDEGGDLVFRARFEYHPLK